MRSRIRLLTLIVFAALSLGSRLALASAASDPLFTAGVLALREGRVGDAIGDLETLADRGTLDAAASYDRGLAYAMRVRIGAEVPGDLGRAAQGFEEARDLSDNPALVRQATQALGIVRGQVARRRMQAHLPVEVDEGPSLSRTLAGLLAEDTWAALAIAASLALTIGLFVRWLGDRPRLRIAAGLIAGVSAPLLALASGMTLAARHDRLTLREAIVVAADARPTDERGLAIPGATTLPEGARVEIVSARAAGGASTRIRFGSKDEWVSQNALRELARR